MSTTQLHIPTEAIGDFCRRWKVREFSLFGSILREDFHGESDVDVLVSFADDAPWSLWDWAAMTDELQIIFGRSIDLLEKEGLRNPFRRHEILRTRQVIYAA